MAIAAVYFLLLLNFLLIFFYFRHHTTAAVKLIAWNGFFHSTFFCVSEFIITLAAQAEEKIKVFTFFCWLYHVERRGHRLRFV